MTDARLPERTMIKRRTKKELAELDDAIVRVVEAEHPIGLRGIYYRVVSAGAIEKTEAGYKVISRQLKALRRSGRVPYEWVTDGNRSLTGAGTWSSMEQMLQVECKWYRRSLWDNQPNRIIILSEKDAILGTVEPVANRWDVKLGATRGYSSETFAFEIASEIRSNSRRGITTHIFNLGDHDPSGLDLWRDIQEKIVTVFAPDSLVTFKRLGVTPDQITKYNLLTRPTKASDTRSKGFEGGSVEVDAIPSAALRDLVQDAIMNIIDHDLLAETREIEQQEKIRLQEIIGGVA